MRSHGDDLLHSCAAPGCPTTVTHRAVVCSDHERALPKPLLSLLVASRNTGTPRAEKLATRGRVMHYVTHQEAAS